MNKWKSTFEKPEPRKLILIATEDHRVGIGYMNEIVFPGGEIVHSFCCESYDYIAHRYIYHAVNAIAWIELPDFPELKGKQNMARERFKREMEKRSEKT